MAREVAHERPWVVDGAISPRPVVTITIAADHRVSDGHRGGLFLAEIGRISPIPTPPSWRRSMARLPT
ncbi:MULTISPECIES: 2-oxo acid dehydrogenase subunit E2 [unclassified Caulobacter]|uniref:2-oxo acid dehydrogenase subunit E2 n=1 Tax=unclassified Caulobacter TaxID=2648921 RepID=UPI00190FDAC3